MATDRLYTPWSKHHQRLRSWKLRHRKVYWRVSIRFVLVCSSTLEKESTDGSATICLVGNGKKFQTFKNILSNKNSSSKLCGAHLIYITLSSWRDGWCIVLLSFLLHCPAVAGVTRSFQPWIQNPLFQLRIISTLDLEIRVWNSSLVK